ncbi:MAG TPA: pyridoxal-dependent decarboxylase [Bacilli bacterium]|nr:pyridoxal-dependent decarboxylase [Bacilli bacterium]
MSVNQSQSSDLAAWFLGPKGENEQLLSELLQEALQEHVACRRDFHPEDPAHITDEMKESEAYQASVEVFRREARKLAEQLKQSVPFFSMRYQAHMNWDLVMPGIVGYFSAMLYNQNNVAVEGSPVTTLLEMEVGRDFCAMLGFPETQEIAPWGHVTAGGSISNLEGLWAARNLKFYPLALREALLSEPELAAAKGLTVPLPTGGAAEVLSLDTWALLNLRTDDILQLPQRMEREYGVSLQTVTDALNRHTLQSRGIGYWHGQLYRDGVQEPVATAPATMHYSWPKSANILGMGADQLLPIHVDEDGRMRVDHLRDVLTTCLQERRPVLTVVAVLGTTEESAVDPLAEIVRLREEFAAQGLMFTLHADAAWGGYFATMLRDEVTGERIGDDEVPALPMSPYVTEQMRMIPQVDSITIDPHKSGFIPYPTGGLCYRNSMMRSMVTFNAPEIYHNTADQSIGIYTVQGSSPGAAAAAVCLSHRVIPLNQAGYGKILGESTFTVKKFYSQLVTMEDAAFVTVPFTRLPAEKDKLGPEAVAAQKEFIYDRIVGRSNQELLADEEAMALFRQLGPDQLIQVYAFNLKDADGKVNTDLGLLNQLNRKVFEKLSMQTGDKLDDKQLIVTSSVFDPATFGEDYVATFCRRLGVEHDGVTPVTFLSSTVVDPWLTETEHGSFLPVIEDALRQAVRESIAELRQ